MKNRGGGAIGHSKPRNDFFTKSVKAGLCGGQNGRFVQMKTPRADDGKNIEKNTIKISSTSFALKTGGSRSI
jgi:hypothetical protein